MSNRVDGIGMFEKGRVLPLVAAGVSAVGCGAQAGDEMEMGSNGQPLFADSSRLFMPTGDSSKTRITMCWQNSASGHATERDWVEDAIEDNWDDLSWVDITWRRAWDAGGCGAGSIPIGRWNDVPQGDGNGIMHNLGRDGAFVGWGCAPFQTCIEATAVHEFGHLLRLHQVRKQDQHPQRHIISLRSPWPGDEGGGVERILVLGRLHRG